MPEAPPRRRARWAERAELAAVLLFTAWVAAPYLTPGRWVTSFDTVAYSGPNLEATFDAFRDGYLPGWNDHLFGGVPHLANPQTTVFYPVKLAALPLDVPRAMNLLVAFHLFLLAVGGLVLARRALRVRPPAGLVAAVVVVGSGQVMVRTLFFEQISVLAWAPWLLLAIDAVARSGRSPVRWAPVAGLALVTGSMLLAGHPQTSFLAAALAAAWALGRLADADVGWGERLAGVGRLGAGVALGAGLAAAQLLPTAELAARSASADGRDVGWVAQWGVAARKLPVALLGDVGATDHPTSVGSHEAVSYVGAVAAALAVVGAWSLLTDQRGRVTALCLVGASGVAVALALGPRFPPYRVASRLVPLFDQARVPARWLLVVVVVVALLAAVAVDRLRASALTGQARAPALASVALVGLAAVVVGRREGTGAAAWWWALAFAAVLVAVVAAHRRRAVSTLPALVLAVLLVGELGGMARHSNPRALAADEPYTAAGPGVIGGFLAGQPGRALALTPDAFDDDTALQWGLRPNTNLTAGVRSIDGYDGGVQVTTRWAEAMAGLSGGRFDSELLLRDQVAPPLPAGALAGVGVRWVVVDEERWPAATTVPGWRGPVLVDGPRSLWENPAWVGEAVLRGGGPPVGLGVQRPRPGVVEVVEVAGPGLLVLDEQWDPGWDAHVDGAAAEVEVVDGWLVGVPVGPGQHDVRLDYRVPRLAVGTTVSLLSLLGTVALVGRSAKAAGGRPRG